MKHGRAMGQDVRDIAETARYDVAPELDPGALVVHGPPRTSQLPMRFAIAAQLALSRQSGIESFTPSNE